VTHQTASIAMSLEPPSLSPNWPPEWLLAALPDIHAQSLLYNHFQNLDEKRKGRAPPPKVTVGILGAGAAGLYSALLLDWLNNLLESQKELFRFDYEILEAEPERVGGRMYTYRFKSGKKYDYYVSGLTIPSVPYLFRHKRMLGQCVFLMIRS